MEDKCTAFLIIGWIVVIIMIAIYALETWELNNTPYKAKNRLNDLISAITEMGSNKYALKSEKEWASCLYQDEEYWKKIFVSHPEFFRKEKNGDKWGVRFRLNFEQNYRLDVSAAKKYLEQSLKFSGLDKASQKKFIEDHSPRGRRPMTDDEISKVIKMAVSLHTAALTQSRDAKWFLPILATIAVALLGIYFKK